MHQRIAHVALVVKDYDEAIDFYINNLDFIQLYHLSIRMSVIL